MVDSIVLWNEPNNLSHWNFHLDPDWRIYAETVRCASEAIREIAPDLPVVLGGVSSCDVDFLRLMKSYGTLQHVDAVGVHGFPLDWNHWRIEEWPQRLLEAGEVSELPVWVTEVGASTFGAEEIGTFGLKRTLQLLHGAARVYWYSLFDLPPSWPAETRHKEAEGSAYYRHYYLGLLRHDGSPKPMLEAFPADGSIGICQWFHFEDPRLENAVHWMHRLGVRHLRTGLSWADFYRPNAVAWFDRMMEALAPFEVAVTLCFTPGHLGLEEHHTSPPRDPRQFAEFAAWAVERYCLASPEKSPVEEALARA
ncbi:glycoside hydrolase 5 family protein [Terriglobus albidus]|uniref:beta-xylosidase n=1 Tax=Terriglobus albidus TaxID=1592106 RepID=UPI0021DFAB52|nr:beta-xylosidase [Terriglobus albidus]